MLAMKSPGGIHNFHDGFPAIRIHACFKAVNGLSCRSLRGFKNHTIVITMRTRFLSTIALLALPLATFATEYQTVEHQRQECWNEQVATQSGGLGYDGVIVGGIAGGILGNQVGGGNGKAIATAVGAITGAIVGDRMAASAPSYQTVRRCRTVVDRELAPVYFEPTSEYSEPVQVYYEAAPVVEQRRYYIERPEPSHREQWRREDRSRGRDELGDQDGD